ncbi:MAG: hypothetical protein M3450_01005 [Actinomycetota bacterium]|nr:hypothetical protein [Actinomycetota bacterium]
MDLILFLAAGSPTLQRTAVFLFAVVAAATIMTGLLVLAGSLAFFAGRDEAGELGFHAMLPLGSYPVDIFAGTAKVLLDTKGAGCVRIFGPSPAGPGLRRGPGRVAGRRRRHLRLRRLGHVHSRAPSLHVRTRPDPVIIADELPTLRRR